MPSATPPLETFVLSVSSLLLFSAHNFSISESLAQLPLPFDSTTWLLLRPSGFFVPAARLLLLIVSRKRKMLIEPAPR